MKLDTRSVADQILKIMDDDGLSAEEIANKSGISKVTIYRIINERAGFTQRAVARKIASGTGRTFKITGDKIEFFKEEKLPAQDDLDDEEKAMLELYRKQSPENQKEMLELMEHLAKVFGKDKKEK